MAEVKLFFALWPEPAERDRLAELQQAIAPRGSRLTHADDLHVTLVYLGRVTPVQQAEVEKAAGAIEASSFTLKFESVKFWRRPRILCCLPNQTPEALSDLVRQLQRGMADCGFAPEKRPYQPHVTLVRKARGGKPHLIDKPIQWQAKRFVLAASGMAEGKPRYRILKSWPLGS